MPLTPRNPLQSFPRRLACLAGVAALLWAAGPAAGDEPVGKLLRLKLPLVGNADQVFQGVLQRTTDQLRLAPRQDGARPVLIIEFTGQSEAAASDFERCLSLSRFIRRELTAVRTVAYLPSALKGHEVLIALACEEIAMSRSAVVGDAGRGEDPSRPIEPSMAAVYEEVAKARRPSQTAIIQGMIDPRLEVLRIEGDSGVDFILSDQLERVKQEQAIVNTRILAAAGSPLLLEGSEARDLGFAKYLASNESALARAMNLPAEAVREDQSTIADWKPVFIDIKGAINRRVAEQVSDLIAGALDKRGANWIGFRINSGGGRIEECVELALIIAELESDKVRTVAYVPREAAGGAALVALACDQLIMHDTAELGGGIDVLPDFARGRRRNQPQPAMGVPPENQITQRQLGATLTSIEDSLAELAGRNWSIMAATVDPQLQVFEYSHVTTGERELFSERELADLPEPGQWRQGDEITRPNKVLTLTGKDAQRLGVAYQVLESYDDLKQLYGFSEDPPIEKPNWAIELVRALATPWLTGLLLMFGFVGIYIELNTPGLGVGAFVASVAFLLFFWSHFLDGTAAWLEVLLFFVGVFFILMEIFVLPGFGIFGLGGAAMVLVSLVLVSQTFGIPKTPGQMAELRQTLTMLVLSLMGCMVVGFVLRRYLPHAPGFRRVLLMPVDAAELADLDHRESLADYAHLVGQSGHATTNLMPSGKAEINGELLDVIGEGRMIEKGDEIVVTSARASRVVVRRK